MNLHKRGRRNEAGFTRTTMVGFGALALVAATMQLGAVTSAGAATCVGANPCNLRVTGSTSTTITLAWDRPADVTRFHHYDVMRQSTSSSWTWVADISPSSTTTYRATGLRAGRTYSFKILQEDARDTVLGSSAVVTAVPGSGGTTSTTTVTTIAPSTTTTVPSTTTTTVPSTTTTTVPSTTTTTVPSTTTTTSPPPPPPPPPTSSWAGPGYWSKWSRTFPADPNFFPIGVWLQDPRRIRNGQTNAVNYRNIGVNTFVGIWGAYDASHDAAIPSGTWVLPFGDDGVTAAAKASTKVAGYVIQDEPDMALHDIDAQGNGRCILAAELANAANAVRSADPTRPTLVNFGKGFALPDFYSGSNCPWPGDARDSWRAAGSTGDFLPDQVNGPYEAWGAVPDIASVDHYATTDQYEPAANKQAWGYGRAVRRLARYSPGKPNWAFIQVTNINDGAFSGKPTLDQVSSFVWLALVNGASGIEYFAHCFNPIVEDCLLTDPAMTARVGAINARIASLAPQLNAPPVTGAVSTSGAAVEYTVRDSGGRHIFAVGRASGSTTFTGVTGSSVEVIGEGRTLPITGGSFTDNFTQYGVHLYKVKP